jgi:hypothetical protein
MPIDKAVDVTDAHKSFNNRNFAGWRKRWMQCRRQPPSKTGMSCAIDSRRWNDAFQRIMQMKWPCPHPLLISLFIPLIEGVVMAEQLGTHDSPLVRH